MARLIVPTTKCDDVDVGIVAAVTATEGSTVLDGGWYKVAAMGTDLLWKLGAVAVDPTTGSYLANGDQELVFVPADATPLRYIRSTNSTADGEINITVANLFEAPGVDPRNYF